jgi:hypothetical protein
MRQLLDMKAIFVLIFASLYHSLQGMWWTVSIFLSDRENSCHGQDFRTSKLRIHSFRRAFTCSMDSTNQISGHLI